MGKYKRINNLIVAHNKKHPCVHSGVIAMIQQSFSIAQNQFVYPNIKIHNNTNYGEQGLFRRKIGHGILLQPFAIRQRHTASSININDSPIPIL